MGGWPFCASDHRAVIETERDPGTLAVERWECGAGGARAESPEPEHAVFVWDRRHGRLSLVE
jgi:hypothetical protein